MDISLFVPYFSTVDSSFVQNCTLTFGYHLKYAAPAPAEGRKGFYITQKGPNFVENITICQKS